MIDSDIFYNRVLSLKNSPVVNYDLFIETGTATGETSLWASTQFKKVITIELMDDLYKSSVEKFWNVDNVKLLHGDSSEWLTLIFHHIQKPAIWFLDAHNVNRDDGLVPDMETPILKEIEQIIYSRSETIIIDDLRLFGTEPGYPPVDQIEEIVSDRQYDFKVIPEEDLMIAVGTIKFEGK